MDLTNENNQVSLSGRVLEDPLFSHELFGEAFYRFELAVPRLSGVEDVLPVTVSGRLLPCLPNAGDELLVFGQLRSYNMQTERANRLLVTVFAKSISQRRSETEGYMNEIMLTGYICKPPVYRTTPFSREIADMLLAVNRPYHKSDYLPVIAWGRNARFVGGLEVGDRLHITGRVQSRHYQKALPDGTVLERIAYEVSAATVSFDEPSSAFDEG
ncbi:single-stranded DNA-binding protein [Eubacteriales bacterium OttesenSCG-928-K08]|nr:single-stranded DNA-binding protein [Eubacteriales bacterium OttesenSCG-928-K08]